MANKTDLCDNEILAETFKNFPNIIYISGKKGEISELLTLLQSKAAELNQSSQKIVNNSRHYEALHKSAIALNDVLEGLTTQRTSDLIALDIRKALFHLGEITGEITSDDLLANIFSRFCIGK